MLKKQKIFSIPLNPKLNQNQFDYFVDFVKSYKDYIYDIYFTSRIAPFNQDAMGDVFLLEEYHRSAIDAALHIKNSLGVDISATFNNIHVSSNQKNLDLFIENFRPLYDAGVRSATIPHTQWVMTGQIQTAFPELYIKNTILRDVNRANQVYAEAKAGFNYINLDRDLMRDRDELLKIAQVKQKFPDLKISLLANEGCAGGCPIMNEHYQYNCTRTATDPQYFTSSIARISCQKWDYEDPAIMLKTANLPPWREDWDELLSLGIDTFKMHGRESITRLFETLNIIKRYAAGESILFDGFEEYLEDNNLEDRPINAWRKVIKNCKFDCWDCNFCDRVYTNKSTLVPDDKILKLVNTIAFHDNREYEPIDIPGLTSARVQNLLTGLADMSSAYLEIGSFLGATAASVLRSTNIKIAHFVDHWQQHIQAANDSLNLPENSKQTFIKNIRRYKTDQNLMIYDGDLFDIDTTGINNIDLMLYDGPHDFNSTARAVKYYARCLAEQAILVFDDANWQGVVDGAKHGIADAGLSVLYEKIMLNDQEDTRAWWNGVYVVLVSKA